MLNNRISFFNKLFFPILLVVCLMIFFVVPIFAVSNNEDFLKYPPDDLGETYTSEYASGFNKYYIKIDITNAGTYDIYARLYSTSDSTSIPKIVSIIVTEDNTVYTSINERYENYGFCAIPNFIITSANVQYLYIPVYIYNGKLYNNNKPSNCTYYISSTTNPSIIAQEAYQVGYNNGYNIGFDDGLVEGADIKPELNLVQYVNSLMANFVGEENAQYVTPLAISLVILFAYFAFIRILLSFIKSKNVLKVTDIVVCVACVAVLLVMYIPMIPFNITQNQIITHVYDIASDVVVGG